LSPLLPSSLHSPRPAAVAAYRGSAKDLRQRSKSPFAIAEKKKIRNGLELGMKV
jgi:hypothetical protein